ncbi:MULTISPECIES: hypothetical protein [Streptomyces]|uniref:hypothetical protein n=1 Tax=Streptomyces TaxID=1883 RepID=UPI00163CCC4E|nr:MULTISPECIES: hypothetical protein [Streptomyces]MBC2874287.1 hypothetical protein [Streptomyces sp. TYQ1024]UBI40322.1 hypothetical protein K7I03_30315 [Streptomyces mobaraensis]UKW32902.1 hypothetical protein MCU78_30235 [Streptomyces sp. TYQ1024]
MVVRSVRLMWGALGTAALALAAGSTFVISAASADPKPRAAAPAATTPHWARVSAGGTLFAGEGITSVVRFGNGRYNLDTNFNAQDCALTGTVNNANFTDPGPGTSSILVGLVSSNRIFVRTATPSSGSVDDDRPFSVVIACH